MSASGSTEGSGLMIKVGDTWWEKATSFHPTATMCRCIGIVGEGSSKAIRYQLYDNDHTTTLVVGLKTTKDFFQSGAWYDFVPLELAAKVDTLLGESFQFQVGDQWQETTGLDGTLLLECTHVTSKSDESPRLTPDDSIQYRYVEPGRQERRWISREAALDFFKRGRWYSFARATDTPQSKEHNIMDSLLDQEPQVESTALPTKKTLSYVPCGTPFFSIVSSCSNGNLVVGTDTIAGVQVCSDGVVRYWGAKDPKKLFAEDEVVFSRIVFCSKILTSLKQKPLQVRADVVS